MQDRTVRTFRWAPLKATGDVVLVTVGFFVHLVYRRSAGPVVSVVGMGMGAWDTHVSSDMVPRSRVLLWARFNLVVSQPSHGESNFVDPIEGGKWFASGAKAQVFRYRLLPGAAEAVPFQKTLCPIVELLGAE